MSIAEEVQHHHENALFTHYAKRCPHCNRQGPFPLADVRKRWVYLILWLTTPVIVKYHTWLVRRRCECNRRFTDYPPFLVPYRRYVVDAIAQLAPQVLSAPSKSYRAVVRSVKTGRSFEYQEPPSGPQPQETPSRSQQPIEPRALAHTTVWRWLSCLGKNALAKWARQCVKELLPKSGVDFHRVSPAIDPRRYRSEARHELLQNAARGFQIVADYRKFFEKNLLPRFATR